MRPTYVMTLALEAALIVGLPLAVAQTPRRAYDQPQFGSAVLAIEGRTESVRTEEMIIRDQHGQIVSRTIRTYLTIGTYGAAYRVQCPPGQLEDACLELEEHKPVRVLARVYDAALEVAPIVIELEAD